VGLNEYAERLSEDADDAAMLYGATGNGVSFTAGRVSFFLGLHGPSLAGLVILPLGPIDLYGKGGAINWSADTTIGGSTTSRSGTDAFYGAGIGFYIWKLGFRAEYERFQIKDVDRVDLFSVSALFQF